MQKPEFFHRLGDGTLVEDANPETIWFLICQNRMRFRSHASHACCYIRWNDLEDAEWFLGVVEGCIANLYDLGDPLAYDFLRRAKTIRRLAHERRIGKLKLKGE